MESVLPGLLIAILTIGGNHFFQARRDRGQRNTDQKRKSIENVIRSCQQVLDDVTRFATVTRRLDIKEMQAFNETTYQDGTAITTAKADVLLVFDDRLRDTATRFLEHAGVTREVIVKTIGQGDIPDSAIQVLNNLFGEMCERARELLLK